MVFKGGIRENRIYIVIAVFIIFLIVFTVFFSSTKFTAAKIEAKILGDDWLEDIDKRVYNERLLGLEKQQSFTYYTVGDNVFPAFVTVTTFKTLFMMSEEELLDKTVETIIAASQNDNILLDDEPEINSIRVLKNVHKTMYIVYNGTLNSSTNMEQVKIIGETWNCGISGTSIICIGLAQISNNTIENDEHWAKIIRDKEGTFGLGSFQGEDGLIYNVKCH